MAQLLVRSFLVFSLIFPGSFVHAAESRTDVPSPRQQVATIIFSGLGGAVLGLSTLSFYGRPQDRLNNISIGFAVGVIGGALYTTYQAATRPYQPYQAELWHELDPHLSDSLTLRALTPPKKLEQNSAREQQAPTWQLASWQFSF